MKPYAAPQIEEKLVSTGTALWLSHARLPCPESGQANFQRSTFFEPLLKHINMGLNFIEMCLLIQPSHLTAFY